MKPEEAISLFRRSFIHKGGDMGFIEREVHGVKAHQEEIDTLLERASENWRVSRMSYVDRNILRMAVYEILYEEEIPPKVSIDEAVELGRTFGSEDSSSYINGVLDRIYHEISHLSHSPSKKAAEGFC